MRAALKRHSTGWQDTRHAPYVTFQDPITQSAIPSPRMDITVAVLHERTGVAVSGYIRADVTSLTSMTYKFSA